MAKQIRFKIFSSALIFLALLVAPSLASEGSCHKNYKLDIEQQIVVPLLREKFGNDYAFYNFETPFVETKGETIEFSFTPTKVIDGRRLMSERDFVIQLDHCSLRVLRTYEEQY
jgi:hypothetical protein